MKEDRELKYFIAFNQDIELGARTFAKLGQKFSSLEEAWRAGAEQFRKKGLPENLIKKIISLRQHIDPQKELEKVQRAGVKVVTIKDKSYPRLLKEINDPPAILYIRGELHPEDELAIAVIGSREYSYYGRQVVEKLVPFLAQAGLTIVSGLALGIDGYAHRETLKTDSGRTIAVLPTGVDRIYPACHYDLAQQIIKGRGAAISEFPLGTPSLPRNFPVRNRIIAGLALGTVVIEAGLASGSFLTAKSSLDYNREVFAVPGSIFSDKSQGTNNLIKMGAKLVTSVEDILQELNIEVKNKQQEAQKVIADTEEEALILQFLDKSKPVHVDKLAKDSKIEIAKLNSSLLMMEMKGKIRNLGGNQYVVR